MGTTGLAGGAVGCVWGGGARGGEYAADEEFEAVYEAPPHMPFIRRAMSVVQASAGQPHIQLGSKDPCPWHALQRPHPVAAAGHGHGRAEVHAFKRHLRDGRPDSA